MPTIAGRTRRQLRQAIGLSLGASWNRTVSAAVSSTIHEDTSLYGADDAFNGYYIWVTSGAQDSVERRVQDYGGATNRITVFPAWAAGLATSVTYELWDPKIMPSIINDLINDAIIDIYGAFYDPEEDLSLALTGKTSRLVIPSTLSILQKVFVRDSVTNLLVLSCDAAMDEQVDANLSTVVDTQDFVVGSANKITVASGAVANARITDNITSTNLSGYDYIEFWCKSNIVTAASDIHLLLDDTALAASPLETLPLPALQPDRWTYVRIALVNPEIDTAIISVGVRFTVDNGAQVFWIDDIRAVQNDSTIWTPLNWRAWSVDKEAGELVVNNYLGMGARLLKLIGGDEPVLLSTDAAVTEVPERYIIPWVVSRAIHYQVGRTGNQDLLTEAAIWEARAMRAKLAFPPLTNRRFVT